MDLLAVGDGGPGPFEPPEPHPTPRPPPSSALMQNRKTSLTLIQMNSKNVIQMHVYPGFLFYVVDFSARDVKVKKSKTKLLQSYTSFVSDITG